MSSDYYLKNRDRILQKRKEYRQKYPDKIKECKKVSRLKHIEEANLRDKKRYNRKRGEILKWVKNYYQQNKSRILEQHKSKRKELSTYALKIYHSNPIRRRKTLLRAQTRTQWLQGNIKKEKCIICGSKDNLNFHHNSYNNWKDFRVLCKTCHLKEHDAIGYKLGMENAS